MKRYAIYYLPPPGPLAEFGARWLGWDPQTGARHPLPPEQEALTAAPRRYGLHATLKAPFRLAGTKADLMAAVGDLAARLSPVAPGDLTVRRIGRFLALVPGGDTGPLNAMAARIVQDLDPFRAPLTEADRARRNPERLTPAQRTLLDRWGYPFVMEEFRFHITLTGPCDLEPDALAPRLAPVLPAPFTLSDICLMGEDAEGFFHLLRRYPI
ncbi:DUF1045 domain-containing protein [Falsirhodobacter algicola]|uniref:DUF1045 domain-containing protein n=1 Tax=Falsirhodobacter algicola TaxID=2692330 RepID=A0A8J8SLZ6_9RHOB|nr:DUF1045 domain-containing protein [Falsirhodobacter algicola]QUS37002.1 DUF1045 domain-containing protein [Falsirhodobacter algicola]